MINRKKATLPRYNQGEALSPWREHINDVIFGFHTPMGRAFDVILIVSIIISVLAIMLDSVEAIRLEYGDWLFGVEWFFTILFTLEYFLRLICVRKPWLYAKSFFGLVDLLSIIPTYLTLILPGAKYMLVIRILRVLRLFRVLKLAEYLGEANVLMRALSNSRHKIMVFLYTVTTLVVVFGSLLYVVEGEGSGFTSIPKSVYWAIVTLTTVGYGDIAPVSPLGQFIAATIMVLGYGIIAVPTGIYSAELVRAYTGGDKAIGEPCMTCGETGHDKDALFCKHCGGSLEAEED
ncbi:ion transporter [Pleionea mediterranea]|jgi:voltage-gated potassium channel|uniref:Voltage-gated potassium channel n=1 Tax=Pleionea mediterranea TaxID=523701 RepID=A0A316G0H5_9GAMM|nr:ion transporter [Pleionea mediterranea]PWK53466.1 voltage-gated potassium channel [Pleionea mediterranea]